MLLVSGTKSDVQLWAGEMCIAEIWDEHGDPSSCPSLDIMIQTMMKAA